MLEDPRPLPMTLEPLDDFLIVETTDEESETRAGLILPASAETQCAAGIVTAVGPEAEGIGPGDKVLFLKEAGYDVRFAGHAVKVAAAARADRPRPRLATICAAPDRAACTRLSVYSRWRYTRVADPLRPR